MEASTLLLIGSLGSIVVLLMLYVYIFTFDRRNFLVLWFTGWSIIALNYTLDAFFSDVLKQYQAVFYLSIISFFYAHLLITWGTLLFLKIKVRIIQLHGIGMVWLVLYLVFAAIKLSPVFIIKHTYLAVFALYSIVGITMIRLAKNYGRLILLIGLLNIAWVLNTLIFSYTLNMPNMAPYIISHIILILNAIGLIQLYFKEQYDAIRKGLDSITYLTFHDGLTGLYNKTYYDNILKEMDSKNELLPISLIIGDMDGLKFVNDVFGHHEGDNRLKKMALIIQHSCRESDIIARWGGDEFAIILTNTDNEAASAIRDKIINACKKFQGTDLLISLSLGVATKTDEKGSLDMVLREAEELMYQVKLFEGRKFRAEIAEILEGILQASDYEMKGHIERVHALAREFASALNFSTENLIVLLLAISLHDIGKIGISKDLMLKATPINDDEKLIMRKHVEIGYRIARASGEFAHLADIILYHHEWWNGQGYPQGLKGEEIPFMSRIISILNAYDVMTNQHDKPSMTKEEALQELRLQAGSQFDPNLVQLFCDKLS